MRIVRMLAISGSLRKASSNTVVIRAAARLAPAVGVDLLIYDDLARLPHFDPDLDTDEPPALVEAFRFAVGDCDGLLVSVPEYAHGLPGTFKNGLDWLVGSVTFPGKPIAIIATTPRAVHAPAQLREVLTTMAGHIVEDASIVLSLSGAKVDEQSFLADSALCSEIRNALTTFVRAIECLGARQMPCA